MTQPRRASVTFEYDLRADDVELRDLLDWWQRLRGTRRMPARADFIPEALSHHLGFVHLLDVTHHPVTFTFRLYGSNLSAVFGRDATGAELRSAMSGPIGDELQSVFERVVRERCPLRIESTGAGVDKAFINVISLVLPFSNDDDVVNMILVRHVI